MYIITDSLSVVICGAIEIKPDILIISEKNRLIRRLFKLILNASKTPNRNYSAILATLQITSYALGINHTTFDMSVT